MLSCSLEDYLREVLDEASPVKCERCGTCTMVYEWGGTYHCAHCIAEIATEEYNEIESRLLVED